MNDAHTKALHADLNALRGDLSAVVAEITRRKAEVVSLIREQDVERKKLADIQKLSAPLTEGLERKKSSLTKERDELQTEVNALKQSRAENLKKFGEETAELSRQREEKRIELENTKKEILELVKSRDPIIQDILNLKEKVRLLQGTVTLLDGEKSKIGEYLARHRYLIEEVARLEAMLSSKEGLVGDLNAFYEELNEDYTALGKLMRENEVMNRRLKPKYLKAFGKYANLGKTS